jgi:CRP-like cAMP-binding protein
MQTKGTYTLKRLFPALDDTDLAKLQEQSTVIMLRRGKNLFVGGDAPRSVYALANGCLKLVRETTDGGNIIIQVVKSGEIIGLNEIFTESNYSRTAVALRDSEIFAIDTRTLLEVTLRKATLPIQFLKTLCGENTRLERRLEAGMFKTARTRVASVLFDLYKSFSEQGSSVFEPPVSRRDIAELADVAPETVSRVLADLKTSGVLEPHGPAFKILDMNAFSGEAEER